MKPLMTLGGFAGFLTGLIFGLAHGCSWPEVLWRASLGALATGLLMRWWGRIWVRSLQESRSRPARAAQAGATAAPGRVER